jgi:DNA-binding transcriptional LysR family regulator
MARNLDIGLLRTFVAVADSASMTAAGNALHLTQSAVSQQIARLEDLFGEALFVRSRPGLRLTPRGERLIGRARRLVGLNDETWAEMATKVIEGRVRLGVPYDLAGTSLPPILKSYAEAFPRVEISLLCASSPDLLAALGRGEVDIALIEEPADRVGGECLAVDRLVWVGARGGAAHLKSPLPISMVAETCAFRPVVLAALRTEGRDWRVVFESGSIDATAATVRTDLAVTTSLSFTVPADLDILASEAGLPALPSFAISLHLPERAIPPAAERLARHIRDGFARFRQAA